MSRAAPLVSVIMNCRNSDAFLREAIDSVYAQTFLSWEIVFFDNLSADKSPEIAQSYNDKLHYYRSEQPLSLGAARNAAMAYANGQYICFLDCDDRWLPNKLEIQINCFNLESRHDKPIGLCYTAADRIASDGKKLASYTRERKMYSGDIYTKLIENCFISCSSVMLTKQALLQVGGFNEKWHQVEDWDLWLRVAKHYNVARVNDCVTQIRIHNNNLSGDIFAHFQEKVAFLKELALSDPVIAVLCQKTLTQLRQQHTIARFLLTRHSNPYVRPFLFLKIITQALRNPVQFMLLISKYLNMDMIALFRLKFIK